MNPYLLSARLLAPLMVQKSRQTYTPQTVEYLPGSSLRGALAGMYLRAVGGANDVPFTVLFGANAPAFPDLLPTPQADMLSECLPLTAISCKRFPGFKSENGHGVRDSLTMLAFSRTNNAANLKFWRCPKCDNDSKPFTGVWNNQPDSAAMVRATLVLQRHTGIDRATGTVADGVFYAPQIMRESRIPGEPQYLAGRTFLNQEQHEAFSALIRERTVFAGADRARGLGELELTLTPMQIPEVDVAQWSDAWKRLHVQTVGQGPAPGVYYSLKLASPSVLADRFLRPTADLSLDFPHVELVGKSVKQTLVRGWQSAWGLPKPDDPALERGGVYLYRYGGDDVQGLNAFLAKLITTGVGLRCQEGLGEIRVCEALHVREDI